MPRDWFLLILRCFHICDNQTSDSDDRIYKLRPLCDKLLPNFQKYIKVGEKIVIDETMVPWRGRLFFRQYIINKRHKYGVKLYKLCTDDGYIHNFKIYYGKGDTVKGESHTLTVIKELLGNEPRESLLGSGRTLYEDNFYSSLEVAEHLKVNKTRYCGTLRPNRRGLPKNVTSEKVKKGSIIGKQKNGVKVMKWCDKKTVLMMSTVERHDLKLIETGKNRKGTPVKKPQCVLDYNRAKKGVDFSDQMSSYYSVLRKGRKWWRKVALELMFGSASINAWLMFNECTGKSVPYLQFKDLLSRALAQEAEQEVLERPRTPKRIHTLAHDVERKRKKCSGCYAKLRKTMTSKEADNKVKKVRTYCEECSTKPALCLSCFNDRHASMP